jgi:glycosidase
MSKARIWGLAAVMLSSPLVAIAAPSQTARASTASFLDNGAVYEWHPAYEAAGQTNFNTLAAKIPQLAADGIGTIYVQPFFRLPWTGLTAEQEFRNRYEIQDYNQLDPTYASDPNHPELEASEVTNAVDTAHSYGIKVIFDLVLNHTCTPIYTPAAPISPDCVLDANGYTYKISMADLQADAWADGQKFVQTMTDSFGRNIAYVNPTTTACGATKYDFYGQIESDGVTVDAFHHNSPDWGPAVDYTNPGLISYVQGLTTTFYNTYHFDGWRVDAPANDSNPTYFPGTRSIVTLLNDVRSTMSGLNSNMVMIAETPYVDGSTKTPDLDQMSDATYDPDFTLNTLATAGATFSAYQPPCDLSPYVVPNLIDTLQNENITYDRSRLRYSETHDTYRINEENNALNRSLLVFNAGLHPGIPMIQAGQEIGATARDQLNTYGVTTPDTSLQSFYQKLLTIRQQSRALTYGTLTNVLASTTGDTEKNYAVLRTDGENQAIVMVNFSNTAATDTLDGVSSGYWASGTKFYDVLNDEMVDATSTVTVPAYGYRILMPSIVDDHFDRWASNIAPPNWSVTAPTSSLSVTTYDPGTGDRSMKLYDNTTGVFGDASASKTFQAQSGRLVASYRFNLATVGQMDKFYLQSGGTPVVEMNSYPTLGLTYRDSAGAYHQIQSITANTWYTVKVIVDLTTQSMDVYVNGLLKSSAVGLRTAASSIDTIRFGTGTTQTDTALVDDVNVAVPAIDDNFDADTTGAQPTGWVTTASGSTGVSVAADPSATDKSMQLADNDTGTGYTTAYRYFTATAGKVLASYKFKVANAGKGDGLYLYDGNAIAVEMNIHPTLGLTYRDSGGSYHSLQAVSANTWYKVDVVADPGTDTMDVYVNGVQKASGVGFRTAVPQLNAIFFGTQQTTADTLSVDAVRVARFT